MKKSPLTSTKKLIRLEIKDESNGTGPLYKVFEDGSDQNYKDSNMKCFDGGYFAEWFTPGQAKKIAKSLNVPLEYI